MYSNVKFTDMKSISEEKKKNKQIIKMNLSIILLCIKFVNKLNQLTG